METPSSTTRRVTRSQTVAATAKSTTNPPLSRKADEPEKAAAKLKPHQDRNALFDITNDSPIVGLAMGSLKTPSSAVSKKKKVSQFTARTPGSGEALLRGQVKTLLQKVEEEAELSKIIVHDSHFFNSPVNLVAPTPANTPQIPNTSFLDEILIPQIMMNEGKKQEERAIEPENIVISRSLLLDFLEKSSDSSESASVVSYQGVVQCEPTADEDDDAASAWSTQANASSSTKEDYECEDDSYDCVDIDDAFCENDDDDDGFDELCEGFSKITVGEHTGSRFMGKHIRFVYDDGDEIRAVERVFGCDENSEMLRFKGQATTE